MKVKTSITLSEELLATIDEQSNLFNSRSEFFEAAARYLLEVLAYEKRNAHDKAILEQYADQYREESEDLLDYQIPL